MDTIKASYSKYRLNREGSGISGGSNVYIGNCKEKSKGTPYRGIVGFDLSENFKDNFNKIVFSSLALKLSSREHTNTGTVQIYATIENNLLIDENSLSNNSSYVEFGNFKCSEDNPTVSLISSKKSTSLEEIYQLLAKTQNKILYFLFVADNEDGDYTILRGHERAEGYPTLEIGTTASAGKITKIGGQSSGIQIQLNSGLKETIIELGNIQYSSDNKYSYKIACFINGVRINDEYQDVEVKASGINNYVYDWELVRGNAGKQIPPNKTKAEGFFNLITSYDGQKVGSFRKDFTIEANQGPNITIDEDKKYTAHHPNAKNANADVETFLKNETYVSIPGGKITVKALYGSTITSGYVKLYNKSNEKLLAETQLSFDKENKNNAVIIKTPISVDQVYVAYEVINSRGQKTETKDNASDKLINFTDYTPPSFTYWERGKEFYDSEDDEKKNEILLSSFRRVKYDNESKTYVTDYTGKIIRGIAQVKFNHKDGEELESAIFLNGEQLTEGKDKDGNNINGVDLVELRTIPGDGSYNNGFGRIGFYSVDLEAYSQAQTNNKINSTDEIKITLKFTDGYGYTITDTITIPSSRYIFHFKPIFDTNKTLVGTSLGIGCALEDEEDHIEIDGKMTPILKVNYPLTLESALPISSGGTGATKEAGAWENIVAQGGVITGSLAIAEGLTIGSSKSPKLLSAYNRIGIFGQGKKDKDQGNAIRFYNVGSEETGDLPFKKDGSNANVAAIMARTWSNDLSKRVHRFWFCQTSPDSANPDVSTGYSERYMLPEVSFGLEGDVYYDILTTKTCPNNINIESDYEMKTSNFYSNYCGHITGDRKKLVFTIPIKRWLNKIGGVTINALTGVVRKASGGYLISEGTSAKNLLENATSSVSINKFTNCITIALTYNEALDTNNNSVVDVQINTINATFTAE